MNKLVVASVAVAAAIAGPALAADMGIKGPIAYQPAFSWSGCHAGFNLGYFQGLDQFENAPSGAFATTNTPAEIGLAQTAYNPKGSAFAGGAQVGCDYQWGGTVWGVEADFNGTALDDSVLVTVPAIGPWIDRTETENKKVTWFSTLRGRFGVTPLDGWLFYGTGGLAVANISASYSSAGSDGTTFAGSASTTRTGWAAGGGVEWNVATNWTVKLEYLYLDFGTWNFLSPNTAMAGGAAAPAFTWNTNILLHEQTVRVGVNYRFGGAAMAY